MRPPLSRNKRGFLDELADDLFAGIIIVITMAILFLVYQNTADNALQTYRTESETLSASRMLDDIVQQRLGTIPLAEIITNTDIEDTDDYVRPVAKRYFDKELGPDAGWELTMEYPASANKPGPDEIEISEGRAVGLGPTMSLPLKEGGTVELELVISREQAQQSTGGTP